MNDLADLVIAWRNDAAEFVRAMFGVEPTAQQARILTAVSKPGAHVATKSGHGTGKSTLDAWLILWGLCCFEDIKVPCTAPTKHQLEDILWTELGKWHSKMLEPWKSAVKITSDRVKIDGLPGLAVGRTGRKENPEALQGFHAEELLFIIDEASGVDDTVFEVARGALSTPKARVIMTANPTRTTGFFYRAFHINRDNWDTFTLSCTDSPLVAEQYIDEMRNEYGEDSDIYRVRVLGEFPRGGDLQFIKSSDVEAALERIIAPEVYGKSPKVLGIDVAGYGGDRSVIVMRQGLCCRIMWQSKVGDDPTKELNVLIGRAAEIFRNEKCQAMFIDMTGVGFGAVSMLKELGYKPIGIHFGQSASDPRQHKNKRAECWDAMKNWLSKDMGMLDVRGIEAERLKTDLTGPDYMFDLQGRLQLEAKESMRKRGLSSPDTADAVALTFALPVAPAAKKYEIPKAGAM